MMKAKFPMKYKERWIHEYPFDKKGFIIGHCEKEVFTDYVECEYEGLNEEEYRDYLKGYGAISYKHEFKYDDNHSRVVYDTYFQSLVDCLECIDGID